MTWLVPALAAIPGIATILGLLDKWLGSKKAKQICVSIETQQALKAQMEAAVAKAKTDYAAKLRKALNK